LRLSQAWIVASKDFATFTRKKNIIYTVFIVPIMVSILLPTVTWYVGQRAKGTGWTPAELVSILPAFSFFYLILAGIIPSYIASYSIVGEKVEKSLEPLLATPTTDGEILLGKGIAAFLPPFAAVLAGSVIFMTLTDSVTYGKLGYYFFPNWNSVILLFLMVPLAEVLCVEWNVMVSSRVTDVRIAQQVGALFIIPLAGIYVAGEVNLISLGDSTNLILIAAALLVIDLLLLSFVREVFNREQILTRWR
jgi:ABC-type Na+ efflux pump permease subunit